jgi:CIC family chloride channel protein
MKKRLLHMIDLEIFKKFRTMRNVVFSLIGGSVIGTILLIEPHAAFSGKAIVMHLINDKESISVYFIFLVIILRIVGTTVSLYANAIGGLFLPLMSIGALVGYGYGEILTFYSHFPFEPFFFAAVGAAVFMGVVMKLPLTALVLAMELTFDYNILVATGISVVLSSYLASFHFDIHKKYITQAEEVVQTEK